MREMALRQPRNAPEPRRQRIRRANAGDAVKIAAMVGSVEDLRQVSPLEIFPLDQATVLHWLMQRDAGYTLEDRGEVVAYGELVVDKDDSARLWIGHMIVHPRRRGLGLGQRLVHELVRVAEHEREAREVAISAFADNPRALSCYEACGFIRVDQERIEGRMLVGMRLRFASRVRTPRLAVTVMTSAVALFVAGVIRPGATWAMISSAPLVLVSPAVLFVVLRFVHRLGRERRDPWRDRARSTGIQIIAGSGAALTAGFVALFVSAAAEKSGVLLGTYGSATLVWAALLGLFLLIEDRRPGVTGA